MINILLKKKIKRLSSGITAPRGYTAYGLNCGLKKKKPDLAVIFTTMPAVAAGTFTRNSVKAAPVIFSMKNINSRIQALIINSGTANACTGKRGYADALSTARTAGELLHIKPANILLFSTGVIGKYLDIKKIQSGLARLIPLLDVKGHTDAATAILTTDTIKKEIAIEFKIKGKPVRIGAMAKGAGMIAPHMATLLVFITSDINIDKTLLNKVFKETVDQTLNHITIDGDMSTNDSAVMLCNGLAKNPLLTMHNKNEVKIFRDNLYFVLDHLAKELVKDGEGVSKFITIKVEKAASPAHARKIAFQIANSPLVKTAFYGEDANWGRVLGAAGATNINLDQNKIAIKFGKYTVFKKGLPVKFSENRLHKYLKNKETEITLSLNQGKYNYFVYTSDLTEKYIKINAHYRS